MSSLNDVKYAALEGLGFGRPGPAQINDMEAEWLKSITGLATGTINDLWAEVFRLSGFKERALPDQFMELFERDGFGGSQRNDAELLWWKSAHTSSVL